MRASFAAASAVLAGPIAAMAAGTFDGVYEGTRTTKPLTAGVIGCNAANGVRERFKVTNNRFNYKIGIDTNEIEIGPDGTFNKSVPYRYNAGYTMNTVVTIRGQIVGKEFQIESGNQFCSTHISLRKL